MKLRYLFLAAVLFAGACSRPSETFSTGIIPVPQHVNWGEGTFRMPRTLTYVTDLEGQEKADLAAWMERSVAGRFFPVPFVHILRIVRFFQNLLMKNPLTDRKSTRLNSSHKVQSRMPSSA